MISDSVSPVSKPGGLPRRRSRGGPAMRTAAERVRINRPGPAAVTTSGLSLQPARRDPHLAMIWLSLKIGRMMHIAMKPTMPPMSDDHERFDHGGDALDDGLELAGVELGRLRRAPRRAYRILRRRRSSARPRGEQGALAAAGVEIFLPCLTAL